MKYLSAQDILAIHARIVDKTGGSQGIRDIGLLQSVVERPKTKLSGQEMYLDVFSKAAATQEALAKYHVFVDGNKRTSVSAATRFLIRI
jgi:death on curing protein